MVICFQKNFTNRIDCLNFIENIFRRVGTPTYNQLSASLYLGCITIFPLVSL